MKKISIPIVLFLVVVALVFAVKISDFERAPLVIPISTPAPNPAPAASPTPTPSPRPLSFKEMNERFGPCIYLPTLMYHHIADADVAKAGGFSLLNVNVTFFKEQLNYLRVKGYTTITPNEVINFFDQGISPPSKSVLLTFDDGYIDFYVNAYPLLKERGFKATVFLPTGLVQNKGYLSWDQIAEMANSGLIYFANHTWSHKSVLMAQDIVSKEIATADAQLAEHGLNNLKVFAYPYGDPSDYGVSDLNLLGYKLAFTTWPGSTLCKKSRLTLPRLRVGNAPLSAYGF
jgi:peptidoglycan/xylan/chitin deacetylase (PgdA/CDA1 family)